MSELALLASTAPAGINQDYLLQARQMQALSFAVHIPLVCFGIAFPALVLFVEWLYLRTGDELYRTLAKRWTKVMARDFRPPRYIARCLFGIVHPVFGSERPFTVELERASCSHPVTPGKRRGESCDALELDSLAVAVSCR